MRGWIPVWRKLFDREDWLKPTRRNPASYLHAWIDLCQMAQHEDREHAGERLGRGEILISVRTFGDRWAWSKSAVSRFLKRLECGTMIGTVRGTPNGTVYRIVNYDTYAVDLNGSRDTLRDGLRDRSGTRAGQEQEGTMKKDASHRPAKPARKTVRPADWRPTEQHRECALAERVDCDREADKFRAYHDSKGSRFQSWDKAFTTWLLNAGDFGPRAPGTTNGKNPMHSARL